MTDERRRFPAGRFAYEGPHDAEGRAALVRELAALPAALRASCAQLDAAAWRTPYRDGGWTPREVVHHLADSHMHAYARTKFVLTLEHPTIMPYDEAAWARLPDVAAVEPAVSLALLDALHARWAALWAALPETAWARAYHHPGYGADYTLDKVLALYTWHGRHHHAHVQLVLADHAA